MQDLYSLYVLFMCTHHLCLDECFHGFYQKNSEVFQLPVVDVSAIHEEVGVEFVAFDVVEFGQVF